MARRIQTWLRRLAGGAAVPARDDDVLPSAPGRPRPRPGPDGFGVADAPTPTGPATAAPVADGVPDAERVRPVTRDRVAASLRRRDYRYLVDERGNLCGLWSYRFFSFTLVRDQVLQVRGRWSRQASIDRLWEILEFANTWNARRHHPKVYVRVHDDGRVHVLTEISVPVTVGLSDAQIDHHLAVGLASGALVFDELDGLYPDPVLQPEAT
ncbi:YbjN domain-containing protein [Serinibacter arcticus]|uniref:YbjN domain-containing protein n=1 Tax=Serinibacter arcticus TaxID=1655435 RepID=UPI001304F01B|nr:YbjN domain-containing protein [Serinibacter arcticus]